MKDKIIVILGQTATGKSDLAVEVAKQIDGEIISADSRQVYKGLNIGSGKITKKEMRGIPHYLLDVVSPRSVFSVAQFKQKAEKAISDILKRDKVPIIAGGTGFYIQSIVDGLEMPEVKADLKLRKELSKKDVDKLFKILKKIDPKRASEIDPKNKVRLIRAIEIAKQIGKTPKIIKKPKFDCLQIGLELPDEILKKKIHDRLLKRMRGGMVAEVKRLREEGVSIKRLLSLGLEYRYLALYLDGKLDKEEMLEKLEYEIWHYAKRQKTWFKRDKRIKWFKPTDVKGVLKAVCDFTD